MSWRDAAADFEADGSLRDIYVPDTTPNDWERAYQYLRSTYRHTLVVDGEPATPPATAREVFAIREHAAATLKVWVDNIQVNSHFFTPDEFECDVEPAEVDDEEAFRVLAAFLRSIGRLLGKRVLVTPEGGRHLPFLKYEPVTDELIWIPPGREHAVVDPRTD